MWAEIDKINSIIPETQAKKLKVNLQDRLVLRTDEKPGSAPKNLMAVKKYKGPTIQPQMPKSIKNQIGF